MSDKKFMAVLLVTLALCVAVTVFTVAYTAYLHGNCSIIGYIAGER